MNDKVVLPTARVKDLLSWGPCWVAEAESPFDRKHQERRILALAAGRERWTALDVLDHPWVLAEDQLWVVLRLAMLPKEILQRFSKEVVDLYVRRTGGGTGWKRSLERKPFYEFTAWAVGETVADEFSWTEEVPIPWAEQVKILRSVITTMTHKEGS